METIIIICCGLADFNNYLSNEKGVSPNSFRRVVILNNVRYVAVSEQHHMVGFRASSIEYTYTARVFNDSFHELLDIATRYCLAHNKKEFKFGK